MGIDFVTLVAQIINLLVLIWLLKRFLYRPIINTIDARQKIVLKYVEDARKATNQAQANEALYQKKLAHFDATRQEMLTKAQKEADSVQSMLVQEAKDEVQDTKSKWRSELEKEKRSFDLEMRNLIVCEFKCFADKALRQMADISLEEQIQSQFKKQLASMTAYQKKNILKDAQKTGFITCYFGIDLMDTEKKKLTHWIQKTFALPAAVQIKFKQDMSLICGLALEAGEQLVSWNLNTYLEQFGSNLDAAISGLAE